MLWDLLDLAEGIGTIADLVHGLARGVAEGTPGAFDDPDEEPAPTVPEPPPPRLPDTGWERFAPREKQF